MVQRTKLIDETQDMLLEMLEDMTTGRPGQQLAAHRPVSPLAPLRGMV